MSSSIHGVVISSPSYKFLMPSSVTAQNMSTQFTQLLIYPNYKLLPTRPSTDVQPPCTVVGGGAMTEWYHYKQFETTWYCSCLERERWLTTCTALSLYIDTEALADLNFISCRVLLSHGSNNLHTCKELARVMERKDNHEKEILELQTKYLSHLTVLREKWESLQDRVKQREGETSSHEK